MEKEHTDLLLTCDVPPCLKIISVQLLTDDVHSLTPKVDLNPIQKQKILRSPLKTKNRETQAGTSAKA